MADLARGRDCLDEMFDFRRDFDGLLNRLLAGNALSSSRGTGRLATAPPIEARADNRDQKYHLKIALPGVKSNEVQINVRASAPLSASALPRQIEIKRFGRSSQRE